MNLTPSEKLSAQILSLTATGMPLEAALDTVCGHGSFARLAGEVYDPHRSDEAKMDRYDNAREVWLQCEAGSDRERAVEAVMDDAHRAVYQGRSV